MFVIMYMGLSVSNYNSLTVRQWILVPCSVRGVLNTHSGRGLQQNREQLQPPLECVCRSSWNARYGHPAYEENIMQFIHLMSKGQAAYCGWKEYAQAKRVSSNDDRSCSWIYGDLKGEVAFVTTGAGAVGSCVLPFFIGRCSSMRFLFL